jgi:putative transposase
MTKRKERPINNPLFTREMIRQCIKENNLRDGKSILDFLKTSFGEFIQEALEAEMDEELGYSRYDYKEKEGTNSRNGHHKKVLKTEMGNVEIRVPQDTEGEFEPQIVPKHSREVSPTIHDAILSMYAKGMSTPDINSHLKRIYGFEVSAETVSRITDKILPIAKEWQNRPLDRVYPIIFLDGVVFNVVEDGTTRKKTAYIVYGINTEGYKEILGIWLGEAESSKFWMIVLSELRERGVKDILIASVDGLNGFSEAIKGIYPNTEIQRCIVHQIRNSSKFVPWKDRKAFCADMKKIYNAINEEQALSSFSEFSERWGKKYPYAIRSWENNWNELMTFMKYPAEIRQLIYTTNPIEAFNRGIRKVTKTKTSFRTTDSLFKLLYLVSQDIEEKWTLPIRNWGLILNQLMVYFEGRI